MNRCIKLLEEMEIPVVRDGKISLDEENMEKLYNSYFEKFSDYYNVQKAK